MDVCGFIDCNSRESLWMSCGFIDYNSRGSLWMFVVSETATVVDHCGCLWFHRLGQFVDHCGCLWLQRLGQFVESAEAADTQCITGSTL